MTSAAGPVGLRVVLNSEGIRIPISGARLRQACATVLHAERVQHALVSITLLAPRRMATMHRRYLGYTGATDVITFGFCDPAGAVIGDVYLCPAVATGNAQRFGVSGREELLRLVVHATLHVLGHDHPDGAARTCSPMWRRQERLLRLVLVA